MSWSSFKSTMSSPMKSWAYGKNMDGFAALFATAYDTSIKTGRSTVTSIPIMRGNKSAMESALKGYLNSTQKSNSTTLLQVIGPAVIAYWSGAMLMQIPPSIPCPGSIVNTSVTAAPVLSPGSWSPITVPPNNDPMIFLNAFCAAATIHLTTVSGLHNCICLYPGSPPTPGPGVLPWTGYTAG
jgi:hypothetical protein